MKTTVKIKLNNGSEYEIPIDEAQELYAQLKALFTDFTSPPPYDPGYIGPPWYNPWITSPVTTSTPGTFVCDTSKTFGDTEGVFGTSADQPHPMKTEI